MNFLKYSNIFLAFSAVLILASIGSVAVFGVTFGIEFTGGSLLQGEYRGERPSNQEIRSQLSDLEVGSVSVQPLGDTQVVIRMKDLPEEVHQQVLDVLGENFEEQKFESIGPVIGTELREKAFIIAGLALLVIILYVAFAFRKTTRPVRAWEWSVVTLIALVHDVAIPFGVFAILGSFQEIPITIPVVVALLTVVGYSVNDTVVIFDRVRENLARKVGFDFADTVNQSLRQSVSRSINTSFTTLLVVFAIFLFGGETLKYFSLAMIIGILAGTYSSLFLAPVILVKWAEKRGREASSPTGG